ELSYDDQGRVTGAEIEDVDPGSTRGTRVAVRAGVVVSAGGPWTNDLRRMLGKQAILKPTKGVHIVVDAADLPLPPAIVMFSQRDRRLLFGIPWRGRTIVGTTDTFYDGRPDDLYATPDDADYLLEAANYYFPLANLTRDNILSTWAGLRPLLAPSADLAAAS